MLWIIILAIVLGTVFIFIEAFLLPGVAVVGIAGGLIMAGGVYLTFDQYGSTTGTMVLAGAVLFLIFAVYQGFMRIGRLDWASKRVVDSRVNVLDSTVAVGDQGVAYSDLRPNGKGMFGDERTEVYSTGEFVSKGTPIRVIKIEGNHIMVKPLEKAES